MPPDLDFERVYSVVKAVFLNAHGHEKTVKFLKPLKQEILQGLKNQGAGILAEDKDE